MIIFSEPSTDYIAKVIESAERIFARYEQTLKAFADGFISKAICAVYRSQRISHEFGINEICMKCDTEDGGSCCGRGIENYYDEAMLLANLALNVKLPHKRLDSSSCYFLGPEGCVLKLRHTICVNYLCKRLYDYLGHEKVVKLQGVYGDEIHSTFLLHEKILEFLRNLQSVKHE